MNREFILKYELSKISRKIFLSTPIIKTDKVNIKYEEIIENTDEIKKRSKIIDYKDKEDKKNLIININDKINYFGHQLIEDETNFIFINTGKEFKVLPVKEFYKFSLIINNEDIKEDKIIKDKTFLDEHYVNSNEKEIEKKKEINEYNVFVQEEKKRLQQNKKKKIEFNEDLLKKMIEDEEISVKDLLINIKKNFKLDERVKKLIQVFVKENCILNSNKKLILKNN